MDACQGKGPRMKALQDTQGWETQSDAGTWTWDWHLGRQILTSKLENIFSIKKHVKVCFVCLERLLVSCPPQPNLLNE